VRQKAELAVTARNVSLGTNTFVIQDIAPWSFVVRNERQDVDFALLKNNLIVARPRGDTSLEARPQLTAEGLCRLISPCGPLTVWQFLRMALEELFFG
jgi:hypothetical protein